LTQEDVSGSGGLCKCDQRNAVLIVESLIHQCPHPVHILVADLHEDRAAVGEQVAGDGQPVAQIG
jgi:hypothetical protein